MSEALQGPRGETSAQLPLSERARRVAGKAWEIGGKVLGETVDFIAANNNWPIAYRDDLIVDQEHRLREWTQREEAFRASIQETIRRASLPPQESV